MRLILIALAFCLCCSSAEAYDYIRYKGQTYVRYQIVVEESPRRKYDHWDHMRYNYVQRRYGPAQVAPPRPQRVRRTIYVPVRGR